MSFENPEQKQIPPVEKGQEEKEKMEYDPVISVRRDFSQEWIYRDEETEKAEIDDRDLKQIMNFYRKEAKKGTLLDLGAGSTHLHYMAAIEDKLTHITALDLSKKNLGALQELLDGVGPEAKRKVGERQHISDEDLDVLKITAEARERIAHRKNPRTGEEVLESIREKSTVEGKYDFINGDMHDLSNLEKRKFDNIMMGFALYANKEEEIPELLRQIKERLNPGGKVFIADFQGFTVENIKEEFAEDRIITERYPNPIDYSLPFLVSSLERAGFSKDVIKARIADTHSEGEKDFKYLFVSASNEGLRRRRSSYHSAGGPRSRIGESKRAARKFSKEIRE